MTNQTEYIADEIIGSFIEGNASQNEVVIIINRLDRDENLCEALSLCISVHAMGVVL